MGAVNRKGIPIGKWVFSAIIAVVLLVLPIFIGEYYTNLAIKIYIMALLACRFNLLLG